MASSDFWMLVPAMFYDDEDEIYFLDNLKPKSSYTFRVRIVYVEPEVEYIWPLDNRFTFRTLGKTNTMLHFFYICLILK